MEIRKYRAWLGQEKKMFQVAGIEWQHWTGATWIDRPRVNIVRGPCTDGYGMHLCWVDMDEVVLMQSTGLVDKNGKEIFEGDQVRHPNFGRPLVVQLDYDQYGLFEGICNEASIEPECEVIGNIFEKQDYKV